MAASPAGAGREASSLASFLPGRVHDRETWEGWTRWRLARGSFTPAPVVTADEHAAMTARQRRLHDLHRATTHSNLEIQKTPMSARVSKELRSLAEINALCHGPDTRPGLMVNGGACQGKTETACEALACFEDDWLDLYAQVPPGRSRAPWTTMFPSSMSGCRSRRPRSPPASGSWTSTARITRA